MKSEVTKIFNDHIATTHAQREEVRRFLLNHPRKNLCLDNLCEQIQIIERSRLSIIFDASYYKQTIIDVCNIFCSAALKHAEEQQLSSIERIRREAEANQDKANLELFEEMKKDGLVKEITRTKDVEGNSSVTEEASE